MTDSYSNEISTSIPGPRIVVNISTECEVNSRGINCSAKTHVRGGFDHIDEAATGELTNAKIVADAIAIASVESLKLGMSASSASRAGMDFSMAVQGIGDTLVATFLRFVAESNSAEGK